MGINNTVADLRGCINQEQRKDHTSTKIKRNIGTTNTRTEMTNIRRKPLASLCILLLLITICEVHISSAQRKGADEREDTDFKVVANDDDVMLHRVRRSLATLLKPPMGKSDRFVANDDDVMLHRVRRSLATLLRPPMGKSDRFVANDDDVMLHRVRRSLATLLRPPMGKSDRFVANDDDVMLHRVRRSLATLLKPPMGKSDRLN
ncbi:uncharacterized protein LOC117121162 isoform X1 [Anneissia japonica]|uniref:uncharacterized protein LOC117121162 isoform X1 n=2 Tax=Anneissia japonica TaxID=1529436 RepID=UPI0014257D6D|nr:uncharacterized protein LOC117121162 isoform X1 [Anneissia japonica]